MKREIKFRVWSELLRIMYTPEMAKQFGGNLYNIPMMRDGILIGDVDDIYMQFTGFLDKNGKEIYEGDLLNQLTYPPNPKTGNYDSKPIFVKDNIIQVGFKDGCFTDNYDSHLWRLICQIRDGSKTDYEVIGNIYENPELLK